MEGIFRRQWPDHGLPWYCARLTGRLVDCSGDIEYKQRVIRLVSDVVS